ncbi:MAG: cysteine desulfurase family protein [Planctomycetaceae bacterium]
MPFFDHNATVPLHAAARRAWLDVVDRAWHNPSGLYAGATAAREVLEDARDRLAGLLDCDPGRIVFTAGATAANNLLARHVGRTAAPAARAIVSAIEHPCVAEPFADAFPGRVREIQVDARGVMRLDVLESLLNAEAAGTAIVTVMAASNESGTIQPWNDVATACRRHGVHFHTDAAQWLGKLPARGLGGCDWVTGSGHKFGGPRGVGFILVPEGDRAFRGDRGGPQGHGRHAGTEDVASGAALVAALEAREAEIAGRVESLAASRDAAERRLRETLPSAVVIGAGAQRLWNTLAVVVPGADGKKLVARLDRANIAASTGSACSSGANATARIVSAIGAAALGLGDHDLRGMVRLSGGWDTTPEEWLAAVDALAAVAGDRDPGLPRVSLTARP